MPSKWSEAYKQSIDCSHPKGFSQRAHCQGRLKLKKSPSKRQRSPKKVRKRPKRKSVCKSRLQQKIGINLREGKYVSRAQAIAVAYSQISKMFPACKRVLAKKKREALQK